MGLTVFDLFGQILTVTDMQNFLKRNSINASDFETTAALAIRCFLLLLDCKDQNPDSETLAIDFPADVVVKEEIIEEIPEPIENTDQDFYMAQPAPSNSKIDPKRKLSSDEVVVKRRSANICKGPGCFCNRMFPSQHEKQQHYIEKGCFRCKYCGEPQVSRDALKAHTGLFFSSTVLHLSALYKN